MAELENVLGRLNVGTTIVVALNEGKWYKNPFSSLDYSANGESYRVGRGFLVERTQDQHGTRIDRSVGHFFGTATLRPFGDSPEGNYLAFHQDQIPVTRDWNPYPRGIVLVPYEAIDTIWPLPLRDNPIFERPEIELETPVQPRKLGGGHGTSGG